MNPLLACITLCVGNNICYNVSLVKRLHPDLHLGVMQVGTKPFFEQGDTLEDIRDISTLCCQQQDGKRIVRSMRLTSLALRTRGRPVESRASQRFRGKQQDDATVEEATTMTTTTNTTMMMAAL